MPIGSIHATRDRRFFIKTAQEFYLGQNLKFRHSAFANSTNFNLSELATKLIVHRFRLPSSG